MQRPTRICLRLVTAISVLIAACTTTSNGIEPHVQQLQWLDAADPQADAQQAIKQNDLRLLGLTQRGIIIPGIDPADKPSYEARCGVQLIDGVSDVVRGSEHLRLMQKAHAYASKYNAVIILHCQI